MPEAELDVAADYARSEKALRPDGPTRATFEIFSAWCAERDLSALPASPESAAAFLAGEAQRGTNAGTIGRRVAAIRYAHKLAGHPVPTDDERVRATVRGIRRTIGAAPIKKQPALAERIVHMAQTGDGLIAVRERALLLLGFNNARSMYERRDSTWTVLIAGAATMFTMATLAMLPSAGLDGHSVSNRRCPFRPADAGQG